MRATLRNLWQGSFLKLRPTPSTFRAAFNREHIPNTTEEIIIQDAYHPKNIAATRAFQSRDRNSLWWAAATPMGVSVKSTVRSWCSRRLRKAMREALAAKGYDTNGRSIDGSRDAMGPKALNCWVKIQANSPILLAKYEQILQEMMVLVDALGRQLDTENSGRGQRSDGGSQRHGKKVGREPTGSTGNAKGRGASIYKGGHKFRTTR